MSNEYKHTEETRAAYKRLLKAANDKRTKKSNIRECGACDFTYTKVINLVTHKCTRSKIKEQEE